MRPSEERSLEGLFYDEAAHRAQSLIANFARFKADGSALEEILRILHTLKGSAGMVGFHDKADRIHRVEDLFQNLDYQNSSAVAKAEDALKEVLSELSEAESDISKDDEEKEGATTPFALAQKLLASVSRFESLLGTWQRARRQDGATKDVRIKAELAFGSELEELRKHSFRLAFGHPNDLFFGLSELVALVAKAERKKVSLKCSSEASYILREYIPELRSALVHLVSNCVVHGIETPEERTANGKDAEGEIVVTLEQDTETLSLLVCDDGAGVDLKQLEERYSARGEVRAWSELDLEERLNLLFARGTSLKQGTTIHAGRGVGLSSVKETGRRLGGDVKFETREEGSCVRMRVPSPFYVAECLLVEGGGVSLAVLTSSIESVEELGGREVPTLISALRLAPEGTEKPRFCLWQDSEKRSGVAVDSCTGLKELVVYPAPVVQGMSGAVVGLSDFGLSRQLTIDLNKLSLTRRRYDHPKSAPTRTDQTSVLVVDDSATTRSILVEVFKRNNFRVSEAEDGLDALARLEEGSFDIIVSDLEMPNMNGMEFLEKLKEEGSPHVGIPFLLFTSRDDDRSFQKALLLGADRCVSKAEFKEAEFLKQVRDLL